MGLNRYEIKLHNGTREFSAYSSLPEKDVFKGANTKWNRVIFLLHGFPDDSSSYDNIWPYLVAGFPNDKILVLCPTMRGYEKSSQGPFSEYTCNDLASDVEAWILNINAAKVPVHLIGHDWGAVAVYKAAQNYPHLITSIVTLAIPYLAAFRPWDYLWYTPSQIYLSSYMITMQFAFLYYHRLIQTGPDSYLDSIWKYWAPTWNYTEKDIGHVKATFQKEGVIHSATAYYRCAFNLFNIRQLRWKVDFDQVPTLIISGELDGCMSKGLNPEIRRRLSGIPNVEMKSLPNSGHFLHREDPKKISELAISWFGKHS